MTTISITEVIQKLQTQQSERVAYRALLSNISFHTNILPTHQQHRTSLRQSDDEGSPTPRPRSLGDDNYSNPDSVFRGESPDHPGTSFLPKGDRSVITTFDLNQRLRLRNQEMKLFQNAVGESECDSGGHGSNFEYESFAHETSGENRGVSAQNNDLSNLALQEVYLCEFCTAISLFILL